MRNLLVVPVIALILGLASTSVQAAVLAENYAASACQIESPLSGGSSGWQYSYYNGVLRNTDTRTFYVVCPLVRDPTKNVIKIEVAFANATASRTCWFNAVDASGNPHYASGTGTSVVTLTEPSGGIFNNVICPLRAGERLVGYSKAYSN